MTQQVSLEAIDAHIANSQFGDAIALLNARLKTSPSCYLSHLKLSKCYFELNDIKMAIKWDQQAEASDPLKQLFADIQRSMQAKAIRQAYAIANQMLEKVPAHPKATFTIAHLVASQDLHEKAIAMLTDAISLAPANPSLRNMIVMNLQRAGYFSDCIKHAKILAKLTPNFDSLWSLATLFMQLGQHHEILALTDGLMKAANTDPHSLSKVNLIIGQTYRVIGERQRSIEALRESIKLDKTNSAAWWSLADFKNYAFAQSEIEQLIKLIQDKRLSAEGRSNLLFSYAKAIENTKDRHEIFKAFKKANELKKSALNTGTQFINEFDIRKKSFNKQNVSITSDYHHSLTPIFILGLPRSGSTLVEQILASHSRIEGTIEQPTIACLEREAREMCIDRYGSDFFESINKLTAIDLSELAHSYYEKSAIFRTTSLPYITDKQPFNFRHIGLILKMMPNAIIIDTRRDALDCGLSLYRQNFLSGVDFSYDLSLIAKFYLAYDDLMNHWRQVFPNKIYTVNYENLVSSPEVEVKSLIEHIGLEFESNCLSFHKTKRAVHTASSEQVRMPMHLNSIGIWKQHKEELKPLIEGLKSPTP